MLILNAFNLVEKKLSSDAVRYSISKENCLKYCKLYLKKSSNARAARMSTKNLSN